MCVFLCDRSVHPLLWWQHVHEGGDANHYAHWGWRCFIAFSISASLRPAHGHHLPWLCWHTAAWAGWQPSQAHGQLRYRMIPTHLPQWALLHLFHHGFSPSAFISVCAHSSSSVLITLFLRGFIIKYKQQTEKGRLYSCQWMYMQFIV